MTKAKLVFLVPCERIISDRETGMHTMVNVFSIVRRDPKAEVFYGNFSVAGKLTNFEGGSVTLSLDLIDPSGEVIATSSAAGELKPGLVDLDMSYTNVEFKKPGIHTFRLKVNDTEYHNKSINYVEVL